MMRPLALVRLMIAVGVALSACVPTAFAVSKDVEQLQIRFATLQADIADLQRAVGENAKEIKRLSDLLGEQNAALKKALQDEKLDTEAMQVKIQELTERLAQISERVQPGATPAPVATSAASPVAGASATLPPPPSGAATPLPGELFSQAYADYTRGQYDLAIQEFREYLKRFPSAERAGDAQYWISVCLAGKQKYAEAIEAIDALLQNYPSSDKLPDAHVKKGGALERLGRRREALTEYRYVVEHFPNSPAAKIARDKLGS
jgi:tol-pal system protein YbgF